MTLLATPLGAMATVWSGLVAATSGLAINGAWIAHENGTEYYRLTFGLDDASNPQWVVSAGPQASGDAPYIVVENRDTGTRMRVRWATDGDQLGLVAYASTTELETTNTFTLSSVNFVMKLEGPDELPTVRYLPV